MQCCVNRIVSFHTFEAEMNDLSPIRPGNIIRRESPSVWNMRYYFLLLRDHSIHLKKLDIAKLVDLISRFCFTARSARGKLIVIEKLKFFPWKIFSLIMHRFPNYFSRFSDSLVFVRGFPPNPCIFKRRAIPSSHTRVYIPNGII